MNNDVHNFCENIKRIRSTNKLSKKEMAKYCGISINSLNKIEQGILPPKLSYKMVFYIHKNFGIKPKDLFK